MHANAVVPGQFVMVCSQLYPAQTLRLNEGLTWAAAADGDLGQLLRQLLPPCCQQAILHNA